MQVAGCFLHLALFANRLLVGTASGVTDVSVIDSIPLAISNGPINGAAHGAANSVVMFGATKLQLCFQGNAPCNSLYCEYADPKFYVHSLM